MAGLYWCMLLYKIFGNFEGSLKQNCQHFTCWKHVQNVAQWECLNKHYKHSYWELTLTNRKLKKHMPRINTYMIKIKILNFFSVLHKFNMYDDYSTKRDFLCQNVNGKTKDYLIEITTFASRTGSIWSCDNKNITLIIWRDSIIRERRVEYKFEAIIYSTAFIR